MRTLSAVSRVAVVGSCLAVWTILAACTVEDENPAAPPRNRGVDSGVSTNPSGGEGGTATGAALCGKYGNLDGVKGIAAAIVSAAKGDCRISPVVTQAEQDRGKNFKECFDQFVAAGFQCPGVTFVLGQTKDSEDRPCNSQMPGVQFTQRDFDTFAKDVQETLSAKGLTTDEVRAIAPVFESARLKLVNNQSKTRHRQCAPSCEIGGEACVEPIPDAGNDVETPVQDAGEDADANDGT